MTPNPEPRLLNSFAPGSDTDQLLRGVLNYIARSSDQDTAKMARAVLAGERSITDLGDSAWAQQRMRAAAADPAFAKSIREAQERSESHEDRP